MDLFSFHSDDSCNFIPVPPDENGLFHTGAEYPTLQLQSPHARYRPGDLPQSLPLLEPPVSLLEGRTKIVVEGALSQVIEEFFVLVLRGDDGNGDPAVTITVDADKQELRGQAWNQGVSGSEPYFQGFRFVQDLPQRIGLRQ